MCRHTYQARGQPIDSALHHHMADMDSHYSNPRLEAGRMNPTYKEARKGIGGAPTKYKPEYCDEAIKLGKEGNSQIQIACALDVDPASMRRWADKYDEFRLALTRAKAEEQNWWENAGREALKADKFQQQVWKKSMEARFRDDYTERQQVEQVGQAVETTDKALALAVMAVLQSAGGQDKPILDATPIPDPKLALDKPDED